MCPSRCSTPLSFFYENVTASTWRRGPLASQIPITSSCRSRDGHRSLHSLHFRRAPSFWITCPWTEKNEILTQCLLWLKNYLLSLVVWVVRLCFQACREESRLVWRKWNFSGSSRYLPLLSQSTNKQTKRESQFPDRKWLYRFPGEWSGTCTCPAESLTLRGLGFLFHTGYSQASFRSIFIVCVCFSLYPAGYSHFNKIGWFCCQTLGVCQVG